MFNEELATPAQTLVDTVELTDGERDAIRSGNLLKLLGES